MRMLREFGQHDPALETWSFQDPPFRPTVLTLSAIEAILRSKESGRNAAIGWVFRGWTGVERTYALTGTVGVSSAWLAGSRITLSFPVGEKPRMELVKKLLFTIVSIWQPDYVAYNPAVNDGGSQKVEFGELTYLSLEMEKQTMQVFSREFKREDFADGGLFNLDPADIAFLNSEISSE